MATVYEYARALSKALRDSDEARQMKKLSAKVSGDGKREATLAEFRLRQFELQAMQLQGKAPSQEQTARFEKLVKAIETDAALREYLVAENAYGKVLNEVQQVLAEAFNPEVPGSVKNKLGR